MLIPTIQPPSLLKDFKGQDTLPTLYWLSELHIRPYKTRFIANSSSCVTIELSKFVDFLSYYLQKHVIKYCDKVYERSGKNLIWSIKKSNEV